MNVDGSIEEFLKTVTASELFAKEENAKPVHLHHPSILIGILIATLIGYLVSFIKILEIEDNSEMFIVYFSFLPVTFILVGIGFYRRNHSFGPTLTFLSIISIALMLFIISVMLRNKFVEYKNAAPAFDRSQPLELFFFQLQQHLAKLESLSIHFNNFAYMTPLYLIIAYLLAISNSKCTNIFFFLLNLATSIVVFRGIFSLKEEIIQHSIIMTFFCLSVAFKNYIINLIENERSNSAKLLRINQFYHQWLMKLTLSYALLKNNKLFFVNEDFKSRFAGLDIFTEFSVGTSYCSSIPKGNTFRQAINRLHSIPNHEFSKIAIFNRKEVFLECYFRKYEQDFTEVFFSDVSNLVKVERKEIEEKYKKTVFAKIAHEFKTPVTNIVILIQQVLEKVSDPVIQTELKMIKGLCDYVTFLVNDITSYFKSQQTLELMWSQAKIDEICKFGFDVLKSLLALKSSKNLNVRTVFASQTSCLMKIDEIRVKQVLLNILSNSAKFTSSGEIKLECFETETAVVVRIEDSGIGMSKHKLEELKSCDELSFNVREEYNKMGSGLGISISKQICDKMGCLLEIDSIEGKGTKTTVKFPKTKFEIIQETNMTVETELYVAPYTFVEPSVSKEEKLVILVEDDKLVRKALRNVIEGIKKDCCENWTIVEAEDGVFGAFEVVNAQMRGDQVVFLVTDEHMEYLNGIDLVKLLTNMMDSKRISRFPCFSCSSFEDAAFIERSRDVGMSRVMNKPASKQTLLNALKEESII